MKKTKSVYKAKYICNQEFDDWLIDHCIITEDGIIEEIIPTNTLPENNEKEILSYDLGDVFIIPGLIETHAHMHCSATHDALDILLNETREQLLLRAYKNLNKAIYSGVTTLRDIGSRNDIAFPIREAANSNTFTSPKLLISGTPITITLGHCYFFGTECDTQESVIKTIRHQVKIGADHIKIMASGGNFTPTSNPREPQYNFQTIENARKECERLGVYLAAHTLSTKSTEDCIKAGVHNIIHGRFLSNDPSEKYGGYNIKVFSELAKKELFVEPTIGAELLRIAAIDKGLPQRKPNWAVKESPMTTQDTIDQFRKMVSAGVKLTGGLDMGMAYATFDKSAASAWAMVEFLGYDPWKAIKTMTQVNAECLRIDRTTGSITPKKSADIISFENNPISNIRNLTTTPSDVILAGKLVKRNHKILN